MKFNKVRINYDYGVGYEVIDELDGKELRVELVLPSDHEFDEKVIEAMLKASMSYHKEDLQARG